MVRWLKRTKWWFNVHKYTNTLWKASSQSVNMSITFFSFFFFFLVTTFNLYSLSKFQLCNTMSSTVVTMLHITSSDLIHLITKSLSPFTPSSYSPCSLPPTAQTLVTTFLFSVSRSSTFFLSSHVTDTMQYLSFLSESFLMWPLNALKGHCYWGGGMGRKCRQL